MPRDEAQVEAELLLAHTLGVTRFDLYIKKDVGNKLGEEEKGTFYRLLNRRLLGEPMAYILGEKEFWGRTFRVGPGCLIPRPETETLIEAALEFLDSYPSKRPRIMDVGTGSGCIAITIALELVALKRGIEPLVVAVDISRPALGYAQANIAIHGVKSWVKLVQGDWMEPFREESFDLILSNPPYISPDERPTLQKEIGFEPDMALFAQNEGLFFIKQSIRYAKRLLIKGGALFMELGVGQAERLLVERGDNGLHLFCDLWFRKDLLGIDRVLAARR